MNAHTPDRSILEALEEVRLLNQQNMKKFMAVDAERGKLRATNAELLAILRRILSAHQSGNNGSVMGEAVLCRQFELAASAAIARAEGKQ